MICLSCTGGTNKANLESIKENRKYIDLVEIRSDFLGAEDIADLKNFPAQVDLPCILTYRRPEDGGAETGAVTSAGGIDVDARSRLFASAISNNVSNGGWAFLDLEDDADAESEKMLVKKASDSGTRIIRSLHDFSGVPDDLAKRMADNSQGDRFIPKAAVMSKNTADMLKILDVHRRLAEIRTKSEGFSCTNGPLLTDYILVGMGPAGFPTRVLAGMLGSMFTFCSSGDVIAAPGHVSPRMLTETYNYNNINPETKIYGIVGNPVMHTKSPMLHNAALQQHCLDAVYLPFETAEPELLLENAGRLNLCGLSVTVPHKQRVIAAADSVDKSVEAIGACNTLVLEQAGWRGYNTDWKGFLAPLDEALEAGGGISLDGCRALVIGAGGAARAVVYALMQRGMDVMIVNRTASKAEQLAADFGCRGAGLDLLEDLPGGEAFRLVVQTTSVGMEPDNVGNPVPGFDFSGVEIAYDIIYTPEETCFLREAGRAGCLTINGFPMLKAQAVEQFRLFTGLEMK